MVSSFVFASKSPLQEHEKRPSTDTDAEESLVIVSSCLVRLKSMTPLILMSIISPPPVSRLPSITSPPSKKNCVEKKHERYTLMFSLLPFFFFLIHAVSFIGFENCASAFKSLNVRDETIDELAQLALIWANF